MSRLLLGIAALALLLVGCNQGFSDPSREFGPPVAGKKSGVVTIHQPAGLGLLDTDRRDIHGAPIGIACATCHGAGADMEPIVKELGNPEQMHATITLKHGENTCASCHDTDRSKLRLANGTTFPMSDAMRLCAQCHGPQKRDYDAGSHGGMTGYWDLRQGPRTRNHCLDCHSAHDPAFRGGEAVHPVKDRFMSAPSETHHD